MAGLVQYENVVQCVADLSQSFIYDAFQYGRLFADVAQFILPVWVGRMVLATIEIQSLKIINHLKEATKSFGPKLTFASVCRFAGRKEQRRSLNCSRSFGWHSLAARLWPNER